MILGPIPGVALWMRGNTWMVLYRCNMGKKKKGRSRGRGGPYGGNQRNRNRPSGNRAQADPEADQANGGEPAPVRTRAEEVTIWLNIRPNSAAVTWDGKAISFRPIVVEKGTDPVKVGFDAPGYEPKTIKVVPDEEKTIRVRLKRARRKK